jgi:hypothetical protein
MDILLAALTSLPEGLAVTKFSGVEEAEKPARRCCRCIAGQHCVGASVRRCVAALLSPASLLSHASLRHCSALRRCSAAQPSVPARYVAALGAVGRVRRAP